jgi:hypothetical protein
MGEKKISNLEPHEPWDDHNELLVAAALEKRHQDLVSGPNVCRGAEGTRQQIKELVVD